MAINETRVHPLGEVQAGVRRGFTAIDWIAMVLMIVGALNWGLVGAVNFDLVAAIFGPMTAVSRVVYVLVGLAALYGIFLASKLGRAPRLT
jgi:uncharacterized membrane protein YuzA (DUF378 family)